MPLSNAEEEDVADMTTAGKGFSYQFVIGSEYCGLECVVPGPGWTDDFLKNKIREGCTRLRIFFQGKPIVIPIPGDEQTLNRAMEEMEFEVERRENDEFLAAAEKLKANPHLPVRAGRGAK